MKNVLIIGGAGYIGTHLCYFLKSKGLNPIVVDDFSNGNVDLLPIGTEWHSLSMGNIAVCELIVKYSIDYAFILAGKISVEEGELNRNSYYETNVNQTLSFLQNIKKFSKIKGVIFTSSAAANQNNVYGKTKRIVELFLKKYSIPSVSLRLFNVCGAFAGIGEKHNPETHLIPKLINAALRNKTVTIYGNNARDYIHVFDVL